MYKFWLLSVWFISLCIYLLYILLLYVPVLLVYLILASRKIPEPGSKESDWDGRPGASTNRNKIHRFY
jgi:hypothetical protein